MKIEIWSDIVCPWCAIGKAELDTALTEFEHAGEVELVWRSFELDPEAPPVRDVDYGGMLAGKYGTTADGGRAMIERMTRTAAEVGLEFDLGRARPGNSFDAHRLVHLAADRGLQTRVKERFLRGYLSKGEAIGEHEALERLAVEAGLGRDEVREILGSDSYAAAVRADENEALQLGLTGVPLFLIDRRFAINGAHPAVAVLETLRRVWQETRGPVTVAGDGRACGPDGCAD
ncbi:DsbA family oxidoreductase [Allosalinactinospora lopnorensis]|uniref:DsbA family oxidoreductase n=1 Tax=Allosalinactinospora lopnorensis TaxID=1352348 RepID=UPI000623D2CA|nr:DsbA family oxidoreductase [Allosalinactinospora lopnorensis]